MAGGIHQGGLPRLFPYNFLIEQEGSYYIARAAKQGYVDLDPNSNLTTLCQQVIDRQGGVGSFMLKDIQLPAGLTYPAGGTMLTAELLDGVQAYYTNGVPQTGTAYARTNPDGSIDRLIIIAGKELILDTELP